MNHSGKRSLVSTTSRSGSFTLESLYWMHRQELQAGTFQGRRVWINSIVGWGGFYTGQTKYFQGSLGINTDKHFNWRTDYIYNDIRTPQGNISTNELAEYINYAFNPQ